jgi:hypothetical protein
MAGASILGAGANIFGAQSAAEAQKAAAERPVRLCLQQQQKGLDAQKGYFDTGNKPLSDIAAKGVGDYAALEAAIPGLTAPITMDQKTLEATPGYQFNLEQGIRGVNLSVSGPAFRRAGKGGRRNTPPALRTRPIRTSSTTRTRTRRTPSISCLARLSLARARLVNMAPTRRPPAMPI